MKHMLKKAIFSTLFFSGIVCSQDIIAQNNKSNSNSETKQSSLALGTVFGELIKSNIEALELKFDGKSLDQKIFMDALLQSLNGKPAMESAKAQEFVKTFVDAQQEKKNKESAALNAAAASAGKEFLAANSKNPNVITTASGLQYEILHKGKGDQKPTLASKVKVHYHGTLIDGKVFDSSVQRGEPISFPLNGVIQGWQEGVQLMSVGDKFKFFIPYNLAYGERSAGQIPPYSTLIFEVELLGIE